MDKKNIINAIEWEKLRRDRVLKCLRNTAGCLDSRVYIVGGAVRDLLMTDKREHTIDWDFAVEKNTLSIAKALALKLGATFILLDKKNKIARVIHKTKKRYYELDFAEFRGRTLREDLKRRDFTLNTVCFNIDSLEQKKFSRQNIVDYFGGIDDIKKREIKVTRKDNIADDPLRILRGFVFCLQFGFKFNVQTSRVIKKEISALSRVAVERVVCELIKIFSAPKSYPGVIQMDDWGVWDIIFPEIKLLRDLDQGEFHHLDGWKHSLETVKQLEKLIVQIEKHIPKKYVSSVTKYLAEEISCKRPRLWLLKLAALMHDIGKPQTRTESLEGRVHFYTHERVGAKIVEDIGKRLKLSSKEDKILSRMVRYHLRAGQLVNRFPSKRAKFRFFRDTKEDAVAIILLTIADRRAMQGRLSKKKQFIFLEAELFKMIADFFRTLPVKKKAVMLLDGSAVMRLLKIPPGPMVGEWLKELEEAQAIGTISTRKQAQKFLREIHEEKK